MRKKFKLCKKIIQLCKKKYFELSEKKIRLCEGKVFEKNLVVCEKKI